MILQVIVIHVGTNNVNHTPDQVCEGILEIVHTIREKHPSVYIVLPVSAAPFIFYKKYSYFKIYYLHIVSFRVYFQEANIRMF